MRIALAGLALMPLTAACATPAADPPVAGGGSGFVCRNDNLGQFTGQPASQQLGTDMLRVSGARTIRWVPEGGVVTMDFREDRLTVQLDGQNRVQSAACT